MTRELGLPDFREEHPHGRGWTRSEWTLLWLLAEARWRAEATRGLYDAALDEFAPFPNVVKKPFPWESDWQLSESEIAKAQELWTQLVADQS